MTYTTAEKLNNVNAAARDAYAALMAAADAVYGIARMAEGVASRDIAYGANPGATADAAADLLDDFLIDVQVIGAIRRRAARLVQMTNQHIIPVPK